MFKLMVSYDCGISYREEQTAERMDLLDNRCEKLDEQGLRWVVKDEQGKFVRLCRIHTDIFASMQDAFAAIGYHETTKGQMEK